MFHRHNSLMFCFITFSLGYGLVNSISLAQAQDSRSLPVTMTTTQESDHSYQSIGEMTLPYSSAKVSARMLDFSGYDAWAPRGQDGKDPGSAQYIGQLTGVKSGPGTLDLIYRVNLFWPFGSSGQVIRLVVTQGRLEPGVMTRVHFSLKDPSFAVLKLEGDFSLIPMGPELSKVKFDSSTKLAWFLRTFFPLEAYRTHVVHRIETALRSFADQF